MERLRDSSMPTGWRIGLTVGLLLLPGVFLADGPLMAILRPDAVPRLIGILQWATWLGYGLVDIAIPLAVGLIARAWGDAEAGRRGVLGASAVTLAGLMDQATKNLLCRARPSAESAGAFFSAFPCFPAPYAVASFPSGHATTVFALATVLSLWDPKATVVWLALATVVGWSRVALGSHFPSDVLGGALLGVAAVFGFFRWVPPRGQCKMENRQPTTGQ
jgi:undecaprenyl-diphosphatase